MSSSEENDIGDEAEERGFEMSEMVAKGTCVISLEVVD